MCVFSPGSESYCCIRLLDQSSHVYIVAYLGLYKHSIHAWPRCEITNENYQGQPSQPLMTKEELEYPQLPRDHCTTTYNAGARGVAMFWIIRDGKQVGNSVAHWFTVAQTRLRSPGRLLTGSTHLGQKLSLELPHSCKKKIRSTAHANVILSFAKMSQNV